MKKFLVGAISLISLLIILYSYSTYKNKEYWESMLHYYPTDEEFLEVEQIDIKEDKSSDEILYDDAKSLIQDAINNKNISKINQNINISKDIYDKMIESYDNTDETHKSFDEFYSYYVLEKNNKAIIAYILTDKKITINEQEQYYVTNYKTMPHDKLYLTKINGKWEIVNCSIRA